MQLVSVARAADASARIIELLKNKLVTRPARSICFISDSDQVTVLTTR